MADVALDPHDPKHAHIAERLRTDLLAWLTSVRPDGRPHSVPVWFLWDGATILVFSKPNQKIRNLRERPSVILAIDDTREGDDVVIVEGEAALLPPGEAATTMEPYAAKYARLLADMGWTAATMATEYTEAIRITPTRFASY
ncbi:MAG TPA: pyridoxamine 5'-phosphate oxidase family protein [Ktedonobacterales bacterium]